MDARDEKWNQLASRRVGQIMGIQTFVAVENAGREAIPFHYGYPYPDSYPCAGLAEAAERLLSNEGASALGYDAGAAAKRLTQSVHRRLVERGVCHPDTAMLITNGSAQAFNLVCDALVDPGDAVVVEAPTYMGALGALRQAGADIVPVELDAQGLSVEALHQSLTTRARAGRSLPKMLYCIPTFHNPTGICWTAARRQQLIEMAASFDMLIVEDDAYGELRFRGCELPTLYSLAPERVIYLGSFSKVLAPGVRLGWALGPSSIIQWMAQLKADGGTNQLARGIVGEYWDRIDVSAHVQRLRNGYRERCDAALKSLECYMPDTIGWTQPDGGFFLWLTLPPSASATALMPEFLKAGVHPLPGTPFFCDEKGDSFLRISFSFPDPEHIAEGIKRMAEVLARY